MRQATKELFMSQWLRKMHIAFEVTRHDQDNCIELKFIDYRNNCLLASKRYDMMTVRISPKELSELVKKFEREEIYPILFEEYRIVTKDLVPTVRLIREN